MEGLARAEGRRLLRRGFAQILHAMHFHIAAKRQPADPPFAAALVGSGVKGAAKADGKAFHMHAAPARRQIMAKLMDENQYPEHHQEGGNTAEGFGQKFQEKGS